jgi:hypothetical protein
MESRMADDAGSLICIGTAWVEGSAPSEKAHGPPAPGTELQFSRRGLDSSLLTNLYAILQGVTWTDRAGAFRSEKPIDWGVRRVGGSQPAPDHAAHVFEFSAEFRKRLAELTPARVEEIARNWYALQGYQDVSPRPDRVEYRTEIIQNLAAMARVAEARSARLFLRAVYQALNSTLEPPLRNTN